MARNPRAQPAQALEGPPRPLTPQPGSSHSPPFLGAPQGDSGQCPLVGTDKATLPDTVTLSLVQISGLSKGLLRVAPQAWWEGAGEDGEPWWLWGTAGKGREAVCPGVELPIRSPGWVVAG